MKIQSIVFSVLLLLSFNSFAEIQSKEIQYEVNGTKLSGFVAWDDAKKGKRPGVLVVHEWWGQNEYARKRATDLAKEGYVGFAIDMYGDNKLAKHPEDAGKFMKEIMSRYEEMLSRFNAGKSQLKTFEFADENSIAAIGYCFGGAVVLNAARTENDLAGVVSFHGSLNALKEDASSIETPMLVLNGADDTFVSAESIESFKKEMAARNAHYEFVNYPNAKHSFTNPEATAVGKEFGMPLEYNQEADEKSWKAMKKFLKQSFKTANNKQTQKTSSAISENQPRTMRY